MADRPTTARATLARKLVIDLSIMTVIGIVLALIGPFGSFSVPLPVRLISWLLFAYIGYAIYSPMGLIVERLHRALDLPMAGLWVAAVVVATVPMTMVVWIMNVLPRWPFPMPTIEQFGVQYFYVLVIGGGVTALFHALEQRSAGKPSESEVPAPEAPVAGPRFMDRLPPALGSDLIALEMEDHYVRAHTAIGSELVLMRMRDAVAELDGMDGMQVHRSWWVARHAVEDVARDGRNIRLVLARGLEAPVSRANVQTLKDAGWI